MTDYISRDAAFDAIFSQFCASNDETEAALNAAIGEIKQIPAADVVEVVRGRWEYVGIVDDGANKISSMRCSNCHKYHNEVYIYGNPTDFVNYCPNCGAKTEEQT